MRAWRADGSLVEVLSGRQIVVVNRAARAALAVKTCIAENYGPSSDMFVDDLNEVFDGSSAARTTVSR